MGFKRIQDIFYYYIMIIVWIFLSRFFSFNLKCLFLIAIDGRGL